jgi:hypothetical protein
MSVTGIFLGFDIWFHIKNGEFILQNHYIPHKDVFLFSSRFLPDYHFTNYEWLFGVVSFVIFKYFKIDGIHAFRTIIILAAFSVVYASSLKAWTKQNRGIAGLVAITLVFIAFAASFSRFEPRPQIISALCLALFSLLLTGKTSKYTPWIIFVISIIWANCHIEILAGLVFIILMIGDKSITGFLAKKAGSADEDEPGSLKFTLYSLAGAVAGFLLSPTARGGLFQLADYYSRKDILAYSAELTPLEHYFTSPYGILLIFGILSFIAVAFFDIKKLSHLILFIPFGVLPFFNSRHVLAASMVITPIIVGNFAVVVPMFLSKMTPKWNRVSRICLLLIFPILIIFFWNIFIVPKPKPLVMAAEESNLARITQNPGSPYPDGAIRFLNRKGIKGNMFCPFHWGNFIIFYENPYTPKPGSRDAISGKPFIDGMLQTYNNKLLLDYMSLLRGENRDKIISDYSINLFLLPYPQSPDDSFLGLGEYLKNSGEWSLIYWDDASYIYAKNSLIAENKDIISYKNLDPGPLHLMGGGRTPDETDAYLSDLDRSLTTDYGDKVLKTFVWKGVILFKKGDIDGAISALEQGKNIDPKSVNVTFNLAVANLKKGNIAQGRHYLEQCLKIDRKFRQARDLLNQFR